MSDVATLAQHRSACQVRPELRTVYREWFYRPLARWLATRIFILLEKPHAG